MSRSPYASARNATATPSSSSTIGGRGAGAGAYGGGYGKQGAGGGATSVSRGSGSSSYGKGSSAQAYDQKGSDRGGYNRGSGPVSGAIGSKGGGRDSQGYGNLGSSYGTSSSSSSGGSGSYGSGKSSAPWSSSSSQGAVGSSYGSKTSYSSGATNSRSTIGAAGGYSNANDKSSWASTSGSHGASKIGGNSSSSYGAASSSSGSSWSAAAKPSVAAKQAVGGAATKTSSGASGAWSKDSGWSADSWGSQKNAGSSGAAAWVQTKPAVKPGLKTPASVVKPAAKVTAAVKPAAKVTAAVKPAAKVTAAVKPVAKLALKTPVITKPLAAGLVKKKDDQQVDALTKELGLESAGGKTGLLRPSLVATKTPPWQQKKQPESEEAVKKRLAEEEKAKKEKEEQEKKARTEKTEKLTQEANAALVVRKSVQALMKGVTQGKFEETKKAVLQRLESQRTALGSQFVSMKVEMEKVLEDMKRKFDAQKLVLEKEAERRNKVEEESTKLEEVLMQLTDLVDAAEANTDLLKEAVSPLDAATSLEEIAKVPINDNAQSAEIAIEVCAEFVSKHTLMNMTDPVRAMLRSKIVTLQARIVNARNAVTKLVGGAQGAKVQVMRRIAAKEKMDAQAALFKKYELPSSTGDFAGFWSREAVAAYALGEFKSELSAAALDRICKNPSFHAEEGGFAEAVLQRVRMLVGVERDYVRHIVRRAENEEMERKMQCLKLELQEKATEVVISGEEGLDSLEAVVTKVEGKVLKLGSLINKAQELQACIDELTSESRALDARVAALESKLLALQQSELEKFPEKLPEKAGHVEMQFWWKLESGKLKVRTDRLLLRCKKVSAQVSNAKIAFEMRKSIDGEKLRAPVMEAFRSFMKENDLGPDDLFLKIRGADEGGITAKEFVTFFKERCKSELSEEQATLFFNHIQRSCGGSVDPDNLSQLMRVCYKVTETIAMTDALSVKEGKAVRRVKVGELLSIEGWPVKEEIAGLVRAQFVALKDGASGWVSIEGNKGKAFLEEGGNMYKVSAIDAVMEKGSAKAPSKEERKTIRKLNRGEPVEILEAEQDKKEDDLTFRVRCRAKSDGTVGWIQKNKLVVS